MTKDEYYKKKAVSNSSLDFVLPERGGSIKKYSCFIEYPERFPALNSDDVELGKTMHLYVENPAAFSILKADFPGEKVKYVIDGLYGDGTGKKEPITALGKEILKFAKEVNMGNGKWEDTRIIEEVTKNGTAYYEVLLKNPGAKFLDAPMYNKVNDMILSLSDCSIIHDPGFILGPGWVSYEEVIILWKSTSGIECKSLIDKLFINTTTNQAIILDYKTTSLPIPFYEGYTTVVGSVVEEPVYIKRHVHRQLAFYGAAVSHEFKISFAKMDFKILVQETKYPYEWKLIDVPKFHVENGIQIANAALSIIETIGSDDSSL